jgi:hypothetical protein
MEPPVASTSLKLATHSVARVESREFTVVVFPTSTLVKYISAGEDGAVDGLLLRTKFFLTYLEHRFFTPVSRQKKILGTSSFDIDLSLILQRRLSTSTYDSKSARSPPASLVVYGGLLMKQCFLSSAFLFPLF